MPDVTRDEFGTVEARVSVLENEVEGEKLVSRHILRETRQNSELLAAINTRQDRLENRFDAIESEFRNRFGALESKVDGLARNMPTIVAEAMREVEREFRSRGRRERDGE